VKILIVDDDPLVLESCRRILEKEDCQVILVSGTDQALDVLAGTSGVDLVITDLKMPGRDGVFLVEEIQKKYAGMPVLIMTGYLMNKVKEMAGERGPRWVMAKPFTPDELVQGIRNALGLNP